MNYAVSHRTITLVWLLLVILTGISWLLGSRPAGIITAPHLAGLALLAVAFFKARLVILYFMEVSDAPRPLRIIMEAWVVVALIAVSTMYWSRPLT
jgi:heme/copper-type cytochrome/quinol oxidase subunit 4